MPVVSRKPTARETMRIREMQHWLNAYHDAQDDVRFSKTEDERSKALLRMAHADEQFNKAVDSKWSTEV